MPWFSDDHRYAYVYAIDAVRNGKNFEKQVQTSKG